MKAVALQKAINVIKSGKWTSPIDFRYQDETSHYKIDCDRAAAQKKGEVYTPKPWEGLPYLVKSDLGKIHVRGFLHDLVAENRDGSFTHPATLSTSEIIRRLGPAWTNHAAKSGKTEVSHHRLVFSMSKELNDTLVRAGRNPDLVLRGVIERTLRSMQEQFHPGDSIGYTYGLHHDTDNLHAHVFLHPRTRDGEFVGMSEQLQTKAQRGAVSRHKNQLRFVREAARRQVGRVLKQLADPNQAAHLKNNLYSDRIFFAPRQSHTTRPKQDFRPRTAADYPLEQKRLALVALDRELAAKKEAWRHAVKAHRIVGLFPYRKPKWLRQLEQAQSGTLFRELRELQQKRYRAYVDYRTTLRRFVPAPDATRTVKTTKRMSLQTPPQLSPRGPKPTVTVKPRPKTRKVSF